MTKGTMSVKNIIHGLGLKNENKFYFPSAENEGYFTPQTNLGQNNL